MDNLKFLVDFLHTLRPEERGHCLPLESRVAQNEKSRVRV